MEHIEMFRLLIIAISVCLIVGGFYLKKKLLPSGEEYLKTNAIKFMAYVVFTAFFIWFVDMYLYFSYDFKQRFMFEILSGIWSFTMAALFVALYFGYNEFYKKADDQTKTIVFTAFFKYYLMIGFISLFSFSLMPLSL